MGHSQILLSGGSSQNICRPKYMVLKHPFFFLLCMKVVLCMCFVLKCCIGSVIRHAMIFIVMFVISIPDLVETLCFVRLLKNLNIVFVVLCYSHF
jgi:hypothetical protein